MKMKPVCDQMASVKRRLISLFSISRMMPMMSGPELVERLKKIRPGVPALFMTGHTALDEVQATLLESSNVLRKPFTPRVLLRRVRQALAMG